MNRYLLPILCAMGLAAGAQAQTYLTIFQTDGQVLQVPTTAIDSITYSELPPGDLATVLTADTFHVGVDGVEFSGAVTNDGGNPVTARGFCWATAPDPTTADHVVALGTGTGPFSGTLAGTTPNTVYYVRAFATTVQGTAFGQALAFALAGGLSPAGDGAQDADGNLYTSVIIGGQEWLAQNLRTTHYANGDPIPLLQDEAAWATTEGATCSIYGTGGHYRYDVPFGKLYNWYTVTDPRNACPTGWHAPSFNEWVTLVTTIDPDGGPFAYMSFVAGDLLSEAGNAHWQGTNTATNTTGFTAVPAGYRHEDVYTIWDGADARFWTTDMYLTTLAQYVFMDGADVRTNGADLNNGMSVRCLKD